MRRKLRANAFSDLRKVGRAVSIAVMTRRQLPNVVSVTRSLGITKRTLRRHLSALGLSFRATADDLLGRYARRLLREGQLPVAVVAERLGYAESASFIRAFARWTGETPHAHRSRSR